MNLVHTGSARRSALLDCQRQILERIASGAPLTESLRTLVRLIEEQAPDMRCAVLLADAQGSGLRFVAAPNIPADYKEGIKPFLRIAPEMGSCGTSAYLREPVYTQDTATDPRWEGCRHFAVRNGLRAIWSTPILSDDNSVLGTFAMYYSEPRLPAPEHIQLIDMAVQMARVAIEAQRSGDALREKETRLIDAIPTTAWTVRPDGALDFVNRRYLEYTGLSLDDALARPTGPIHPEDLPTAFEKWTAAMASAQPYEAEMRLRRADGAYRWFLVRTVPFRDERGAIVKWYGTSTDIEDRKRAEEALRAGEDRLRLVIDTMPAMVWTAQADGRVDFVNQRWLEYIGVTREAFEVCGWQSVVHPDDLPRSVQSWARAAAVGEPMEIEHRVRRADGQYRWLLARGVPLRDEAAQIVKWYGAVTDIDDRKRAEQSLRQSAAELQALSRRLVELQESERKALARELHDQLGATLTALSINLAMVRDAVHGAQAANRIEDSAELVKSTAAAIEDIVAELRPPMLDEYGLAAALEWYARQFARRVGVTVCVEATEAGERVPGEVETALFRIAQEALNNVAKHARAERVAITLCRSPSEFVMSIADDGIGLPTLAPASEQQRPGLGLVTMRERAQAVGGGFEVEPLPGAKGTRLTVRVAL